MEGFRESLNGEWHDVVGAVGGKGVKGGMLSRLPICEEERRVEPCVGVDGKSFLQVELKSS